MKNTDWKIFISTLAYTYLFYQQENGFNFLIFSLIMVILTFLHNTKNSKNPAWLAIAFGTLFSGFFVFYYGTPLPKTANIVSLIFLAGISFKSDASLLVSGINSLVAYVVAIPVLVVKFFKSKFSKQKNNQETLEIEISSNKKSLFKKFILLLFPLFVVFVFFVLYRGSNPLFLKLTEDINLDWLSIPLIEFYLSALLLMYAFFIQNIFKPLNNIDDKLKDDISFVDIEEHNKSFFSKFISLDSEIFTGISLLAMLNLLIAFLNAVDINYLWLKADLPQGLVFSDYIHSGTFTLIVSIVLAITVIIFFFRGIFNFNKNGKWMKILGFIWVFQNIIMIVSAMLRNQLYIADYGMTHKRIGVYIFLALSVIGLLVTIVKIALKKNTLFLFRKNSWAFYGFLIIATAFNWDMIITRHNVKLANVKYIVDLDKNYLAELSHVNTFALTQLESEETPFDVYYSNNTNRWNKSPLQEKIQNLLDYENRNNWQENCLNKNKNIQKLKELNNMGKIAKLELYSMYIDDITVYKTLSKIKAIDLQNNRLSNNFKALENYKDLEVINLQNNNLSRLDSFPLLKKLTYLNLKDNNVVDFSFLEKSAPNLTNLNISSPNTVIDEYFPTLPKLESVNISGTSVDSWVFLSKQPALKNIIFTNSNVEDIVLKEMKSLETIDLAQTQLFTEFLDSLALSKNLKEINFSNCSLGNVNYLINGIKPLYSNLEILNLNNNYLNDLITNIQLFKKIKELNLSENNLEYIEPLATMFSLIKLNLNNNKFKKLSALKDLNNLEELSVSDCKIDDYSAILGLTTLKYLNLSNNKIKEVDSIATMQGLENLNLSNNKLKDVSALVNLKNLTHLYISGNSIKDYSVLFEMKNLKFLSVGNIDLTIIEKIKKALPQTELDYYSNNLNRPINYNNNKRKSYSESF